MGTDVRKVIIMGAAGRDFHDFNCYWRDNPAYEVVAFTGDADPGHRRPDLSARAVGPAIS